MEEKLPADLTENLPHEIVQLILSFLSMKEGVRTCLLSTAWSSLWKPLVVNLDAAADGSSDDQITTSTHGLNNTMKRVIAAFLNNHDVTPKVKFSIGHKIVLVGTKGTHDINYELHIDFYKDGKVITACAGTNKSSVQFKLECLPCNHNFRTEISATASSLSQIKTLHLRSITAGLAENFVSSLLSSCCSLESLKLEKCGELRRIDVVMSDGSSLRLLEFCDCPNVDSMVISAPNLKTLYYAGALPTTIQLHGTPNLVDVKFDVGYGLSQKEFDCEQLILFLASLKETEFLNISGWIIEWMCSGGVIFGRLDFQLSKLKKLWCTYSCLMDARKRDSLACFLNIAPLLETLFINMDQKCRSMPPPFFHDYWHEPHLWKDYKTVKSGASHLVYLKVIKIMGFSNSSNSKHEDHIFDELLLIMDLLLHKALNLKALFVTTSLEDQENTCDSWRVSKMPSTQISECQQHINSDRVVLPLVLSSTIQEESLFVFTKTKGDETNFLLLD